MKRIRRKAQHSLVFAPKVLNPVMETAATVARCDERTFAARIRLDCSLVKEPANLLGPPTKPANKHVAHAACSP